MIYGQAMVSGVSAAQLAFTGDNAITRAAYDQTYNEVYNVQMRKFHAAKAMTQIRSNISAVKQDKILMDVEIQMRQAVSAAQMKVEAAAAGVEGMSVDQTIAQTEINASRATAANRRRAEQETENLSAGIGQHMSALLAEPNIQEQGGIWEAAMKAASSISLNDVRAAGHLQSNSDINIHDLPQETGEAYARGDMFSDRSNVA
tara:strand:+ start:263 stop:871 length:609 start_codon:yes stop_codon:yes gene_type:complete